MALTPADVHAKQFSTVKMRTGYDLDEVDAFLDEVEAELTRLLSENDDLRAQLAQAQSKVQAVERDAPAPRASGNVLQVKGQGASPAPAPPPPAPVPTPVPVPTPAPAAPPIPSAPPVSATSPAEGALRILEVAQKTADEAVAQAKTEAHGIVSKAKEEAATVTASLEEKRTSLEKKVADLRAFERSYRTRLREHIAGQLRDLDATTSSGESVAPPAPADPTTPGGG